MPTQLQLALLLVDSTNPYQLMLRADAERMARCLGVELTVLFSGHDAERQLQQLRSTFRGGAEGPRAVILVPEQEPVLATAAAEAAERGVGLAVLSCVPGSNDVLRVEHPAAPVLTFSPDQRDIGRIQGLQFQTLLRRGGHVLYVRGDSTPVALERQAGMEAVLRGTPFELEVVEGGWRMERAQVAVGSRLRERLAADVPVELIGCQNDDMALGARAAIDALAAELGRPSLTGVPVTGCDGVPSFGQHHVVAGHLAATVVSPSTAGAAVEALARYYVHGQRPPPRTVLRARSFPDLSALAARVAAADPRR